MGESCFVITSENFVYIVCHVNVFRCVQVLHTSDNEWLSPNEILDQIKCQNLKEIWFVHHYCCISFHCHVTFSSSAPICSVKKILYKTDGPFIWDRVKHLFALKRVSLASVMCACVRMCMYVCIYIYICCVWMCLAVYMYKKGKK